MSHPVTKEDLAQLISAVNRLSIALERSSLASSSSQTPVISVAGWELVEEASELPLSVKVDPHRVFEDGPEPIPEDLLALTSSKLTSVCGPPRDRVLRAWKAGFWAWAANATHSEHKQTEPLSLSNCGATFSHYRACACEEVVRTQIVVGIPGVRV